MNRPTKDSLNNSYAPILILLGVGTFIFSQLVGPGFFSNPFSTPPTSSSSRNSNLRSSLRKLAAENASNTQSLVDMGKNLEELRTRLGKEVAKSKSFQTQLVHLVEASGSLPDSNLLTTWDPAIDSLARRFADKGIQISRGDSGEIRLGGPHFFQDQGIFVTPSGLLAVNSLLKIVRKTGFSMAQIVASASSNSEMNEFTANRVDVLKRMLKELPAAEGVSVQMSHTLSFDLDAGDVELRFSGPKLASSHEEGRSALR